MHVHKRKRSLFPGIHQSNKSSLPLDVTEVPHSETESPFLYRSNILSCGYKAGKWNQLLNTMRSRIEGSPASGGDRENCTTVRSNLFLLIIVCGITYRRMGQDPKKRVLNISVLEEYSIITSIIFCMVQVSLASQETPVTISRRNSQRFLLARVSIPMGREGSICMENAPSSP